MISPHRAEPLAQIYAIGEVDDPIEAMAAASILIYRLITSGLGSRPGLEDAVLGSLDHWKNVVGCYNVKTGESLFTYTRIQREDFDYFRPGIAEQIYIRAQSIEREINVGVE